MKEILSKIDLIKLGAAITSFLCLIMIVYALITKEIPEGNRDALLHTLGIIEMLVGIIVGFYFGSSIGSKNKTDVMSKAINENKRDN